MSIVYINFSTRQMLQNFSYFRFSSTRSSAAVDFSRNQFAVRATKFNSVGFRAVPDFPMPIETEGVRTTVPRRQKYKTPYSQHFRLTQVRQLARKKHRKSPDFEEST
jgi:hypothetical protein